MANDGSGVATSHWQYWLARLKSTAPSPVVGAQSNNHKHLHPLLAVFLQSPAKICAFDWKVG
jgi:hypothetical protein